MVAHSRAPLGAHRLRHLKMPTAVAVEADAAGHPRTIQRRSWPGPRRVARWQDRWRLDDEWWREQPIARLYYTVVLDDDLVLTLYHDLIADAWFEQRA